MLLDGITAWQATASRLCMVFLEAALKLRSPRATRHCSLTSAVNIKVLQTVAQFVQA